MARRKKQTHPNHYPRKKKKSARDLFVRFLALVMVLVMLIVIIIPVYGPLKELFNAIGKQVAPFTQPVFDWIQTAFQSGVDWVRSLF